jgi:hypothetical protein
VGNGLINSYLIHQPYFHYMSQKFYYFYEVTVLKLVFGRIN